MSFENDMSPEQLLAYLGEPHQNSELTFAAEAAGKILDAALIRLLDHPSALVREGAVYGLAELVNDEVRAALENTRKNDASPGVREAAEEALTSMEER